MRGKERDVTCPSGMCGTIRPLRVEEERLYRNVQTIKAGKTIQKFISQGWIKMRDPGPYDFGESGRVNWDRLLLGDAMYLLMQARAATYSKDYPVVFPCQACNKPVDHTINVLEDMYVQKLPEASFEHVQTGTPLVAVYDGLEIKFNLQRLGDDQRVTRLEDMRELSRECASLAVRIVEVEGVEKGGFSVVNWIEGLDAGEPDDIAEVLDEHDCGLDLTIEAVCKACKYRQELEFPLQRTFFQKPSRRKEKRKKRAMAELELENQ